ncbi:tRNA (adenine(22)-N(1))-methyltransferase [Aminipila sp.]|uniref:tRNA (adenine(22)-N(1))-methyltransferase n=2 Tax=Aminipila sp. TaxID=2060095 RepID=UPI0028A14413|nr:class I SAM-dependent methyltransferase [Aminipila sp.]
MIKLSDRLQTIADLIKNGQTVADIGTDHGFLPIFLWESKKSPKVILADISKGSLQKSIDNVNLQNFSQDILSQSFDFRLGNGIQVLENGEVDVVVMAGMGGILMTEILSADLIKTKSIKSFILQPRNGQGKLRWWLLQNGFQIKEEKLVREGKFICEVIHAEPVAWDCGLIKLSMDEDWEQKKQSEDIEYEIPESILISNGALAVEFAERKLKIEFDILENIKKAVFLDEEKREQTESRILYLKNLISKYGERGEQ